jgi:NADH dehydrogenase FAD-containing subunit
MIHTIVILGAGLTGLPLSHYVLKHYADKFDLKLILVSRSTEFYWNIGATRAAIPGQMDDNKVFYSIPQAFSKHSTHRFEFVLGTVENWSPNKNSVAVALENGLKRTIDYHTIVVATGSDYRDNMPWKLVGTNQQTHAALDKLRKDVENATSIVVGGGGPTGVEFAGELGCEYAKTGKKSVTLVMSESLPLESRVMKATRMAARKELEKLNVTVISDTRVTKERANDAKGITLELTKSNGTEETLKADLFVPTWGIGFNTSFAPASLREANGRLKVTKCLRAPGYDNAFLLGDAANLDSYGASVREKQVRYLATALGKYLAGDELPEYTASDKISLTIAIGRGRGVGEVNGWNVWSFLVWYLKGRNMCTDIVPDYVAGKRLILGSF